MLSLREISIPILVSLAVLAGCRTRQRANIVKLEPIKAVTSVSPSFREEKQKNIIKVNVKEDNRIEENIQPRGNDIVSFDTTQLDKIAEIGFDKTAEAYRMTTSEIIAEANAVSFETISQIDGVSIESVDEVLAFSITEGVSPIKVIDVFNMNLSNGIPIQDTVTFFTLAYKSGVPIEQVISIFRLAKQQAVLKRIIPVIKMAGVENMKIIMKVLALSEKESVRIDKILDVLQIAVISKVPIKEIAETISIAEAHDIPIDDIVTVLAIAQANSIDIGFVIEVSKETIKNGIPLKNVVSIAKIAQKTSIPPEVVIKVYKEIIKQGISIQIASKFIPITLTTYIKTIDIEFRNISKEAGVSLAVLRIAAMKSILAIISHAKQDEALPLKDNFIKSRWEMVTPEEFTKLWEIKCKAEELEAQGLDTDSLWHEFWNVYMAEPEPEDTTKPVQ